MPEYSVLIIDDDIWMQRILSQTLQSYGFKKTYLASNGFEGISLAVEHGPSLIILDILMPELSGHLTLKILKTIKVTKNIPVIMVSALSDTENLGLAVKSGTAGFISKPFTRATVFEKLVSIFGKEKLDRIARGEDSEFDEDDYSEDDVADALYELKPEKHYIPSYKSEAISIDDDVADETNQQKVAPSNEKLKKHYQDDEKRSIESIKKLLLKTKK